MCFLNLMPCWVIKQREGGPFTTPYYCFALMKIRSLYMRLVRNPTRRTESLMDSSRTPRGLLSVVRWFLRTEVEMLKRRLEFWRRIFGICMRALFQWWNCDRGLWMGLYWRSRHRRLRNLWMMRKEWRWVRDPLLGLFSMKMKLVMIILNAEEMGSDASVAPIIDERH